MNQLRCCSVAQLYPTLCDPIDCSMPGFLSFTISWSLLKLMSIKYVMPSNHLVPFPLVLNLSQHQGLFQWVRSSHQVAKELELESASVLPMNIQSWFPLGLIGLISLQSKGLSRVFSSTTVWKYQFLASLLYGPTLTSIHDYWKYHIHIFTLFSF